MDWRLGVAIKSSNSTNLSSPYVSLLFKVTDGNNTVSSHTVEVTLAEFQELAKNLSDMSQLMESLA